MSEDQDKAKAESELGAKLTEAEREALFAILHCNRIAKKMQADDPRKRERGIPSAQVRAVIVYFHDRCKALEGQVADQGKQIQDLTAALDKALGEIELLKKRAEAASADTPTPKPKKKAAKKAEQAGGE